MKLGVFTCLLSNKTLEEALEYFQSLGIQMVEIGCGGTPGDAHCKPEILLNDSKKLQEFQDTIKKYDMEISALSCHGNPVHPNKEIAAMYDKVIRNAILLAEKLGLHQINTFSGCPGDCAESKHPNWVTCAWPEDFPEVLEWQWNEVLVPYWKDLVKFGLDHGVDKIAMELHPGFCVYNTESCLKLREAVGPQIGANLDPSHLIWQGMDPVAVIKALGPAIFHFHAKDTKIDKYNTAVNGVLETKKFTNVKDRSWIFRSVGYGHDTLYWKDIISALRLAGYNYAISIEHEDGLMSINEGLSSAVSVLKDCLMTEEPSVIWWA